MSTVNVLRYSALGLGVFYGAYHNFSLKSAAGEKVKADAYNKQAKLIEEAKQEYAKLNAKPVSTSTETKEINFDDKNLDFGALLVSLVEKI